MKLETIVTPVFECGDGRLHGDGGWYGGYGDGQYDLHGGESDGDGQPCGFDDFGPGCGFGGPSGSGDGYGYGYV